MFSAEQLPGQLIREGRKAACQFSVFIPQTICLDPIIGFIVSI
jgi:hypothetical protein